MQHRASTLWRSGDFMKLWTAQTLSLLGAAVTLIALPLTAIMVLDASPFQMGVLVALETLPFLVIGLPAGVWVDRLPRRAIMVVSDVGRAVALAAIPAAYFAGVLEIWLLYAVALVTGTLQVFFDIADQSYLPTLIPAPQLLEGNSKLELSRSGTGISGAALGGVLVQLLTAPVAILIDAMSYVFSAVVLALISKKEPPRDTANQHPTLLPAIRAGVRFVIRHPLLRPVAMCTGTANFFGGMVFALLILFAKRELELSPAAIGAAMAIGSVGGLAGAFAVNRLSSALGTGRAIVAGASVAGLGALIFPLATAPLGMVLLALGEFVLGFGVVVYNVSQVSLRQGITPPDLLGRMNATMRFLVWGTLPLGSFLGGALAELIGLRATLLVAGIGGLLSVLPVLMSPVRRLNQVPSAPQSLPDVA